MSDQFLLFWPVADGSDDFVLLADEEALIEKVEAFTRTGTPVKACRLVPVELDVKVKARLIKRRAKNSTAADLREAIPPVPSREAAVEVVPTIPREGAQSADDRGARPGEAVLQTASDCRESTEENRAPSSGDASDRVVPPKPDTGHSDGTVCAVCDDPALPGKQFCSPHDIGGVKPEVAAELRRGKGQPRAAASKETPRGPLVPHD